MTNLTRQALGESLKELLCVRTLDRITIQDVTDGAKVSRKTFYYHFHDIYDLVEWMILEECSALVEQWRASGNLGHALAAAFEYAAENRTLMLHIFASMERVDIERMVRNVITPSLELIFDEIAHGAPVAEEDRRLVIAVLGNGLAGVFYAWVGGGMLEEADTLRDQIEYFFGDSVELMVRRCVERAENR